MTMHYKSTHVVACRVNKKTENVHGISMLRICFYNYLSDLLRCGIQYALNNTHKGSVHKVLGIYNLTPSSTQQETRSRTIIIVEQFICGRKGSILLNTVHFHTVWTLPAGGSNRI